MVYISIPIGDIWAYGVLHIFQITNQNIASIIKITLVWQHGKGFVMKKYIAIIFYIVLCAAFAQSSEYTYEAVIHDRQAKQQPSLLSLNKQTLVMVRMASPDDDLAIETW